MNRLFLATLLLSASTALYGQQPDADWRTLETKHFRVHYPRELEAWTLRAADRLEPVYDSVTREVGFAPAIKTDVLVMNPVAAPQGIALPLLNAPRMILYTESPGPEGEIGDYSDWIELLTVHEVTHLVHLLRPSRAPKHRFVERILPLNRITFGAPRWVMEGYATLVEGRLTGSGRPSSAIRASVLRRWAQSGRMPSYGTLDAGSPFLGSSMAYLAGSAYLEWLERRAGEGSLRKVWARMTARTDRSFAQSFEGVFGDSPSRLYGRFVAELTAEAMAAERDGRVVEGAVWQVTERWSGDPAVSPDGGRIALVVRRQDEPARIVILSTGPPDEEEEQFRKRLDAILARDNEDVEPVRTKPLPRKPVHTLVMPEGGDLGSPRWMPDGQSLLFTHRQPDEDGVLHFELFRWTPHNGRVRRITRRGDVSSVDPFPSGRAAVAVRSRSGFSQLVQLDLASGEVLPITEPTLDRIYSHVRVSADSKRIAYSVHDGGRWRLVLRDLSTGAETLLDAGERTNVASPEWSRKQPDQVIATVYRHEHIDLHRFSTSAHEQLTRTMGAAVDPAPSPDGRLFFMSLDPDGYRLHVIDEQPIAEVSPARTIEPAPARETTTRNESKPYGLGRPEWQWLVGANAAPSASTMELGMRVGDVVGRLDTIGILSIASGHSPRGATIASAWRGWPVDVQAQLFWMDENPSEQDDVLSPTVTPIADFRRRGIELRGTWDHRGPLHRLELGGGALLNNYSSGDGPWLSRDLFFVDSRLDLRRRFGRVRIEGDVRFAGARGTTEGNAWWHYHSGVTGAVRGRAVGVQWRFDRGLVSDNPTAIDSLNLGGVFPTIVPRSALANRIFDPALPAHTAFGDRYTGRRAELTLAALPVTFFYQQHRLSTTALAPQTNIALAGLEVAYVTGPLPIVKLPALDLTAGVARVLDDPLRGETKWWLSMRWRP